jgi:hypothetical protein
LIVKILVYRLFGLTSMRARRGNRRALLQEASRLVICRRQPRGINRRQSLGIQIDRLADYAFSGHDHRGPQNLIDGEDRAVIAGAASPSSDHLLAVDVLEELIDAEAAFDLVYDLGF